ATSYLKTYEELGPSVGRDRDFVHDVQQLMRDDLRQGCADRMAVLLEPLMGYLPQGDSVSACFEAVDEDDSVAAFEAAERAGLPHVAAYYAERIASTRNTAIRSVVGLACAQWLQEAGQALVWDGTHSDREVEIFNFLFAEEVDTWEAVPSSMIGYLVEHLHPLALDATIRQADLSDEERESEDYWHSVAESESCRMFGKAGAVERWLTKQIRRTDFLDHASQAWLEANADLIDSVDLSDVDLQTDDSVVSWLLKKARQLEELSLAGCYLVTDRAFLPGHPKLRYVDLSDTAVDHWDADAWTLKFPRLMEVQLSHSTDRVRKLAMVEPFQNMAELTGQGRWLAVKQLESICEHKPTLIMEAMEYA
ncbi:MAG: hypothetical protein KDK78_10755, partial [Chlamydiia bacterium]|nr:hypothetical protein [Chlamydiia bacterium]